MAVILPQEAQMAQMVVLHDNLNEDSASTFSSVFSSHSSSFCSRTGTDSVDSDVLEEPVPTTPTTVAEANALFAHHMNIPVTAVKRHQPRRVSFAVAREPSLNHDVEEISSLTYSPANVPLDGGEEHAPASSVPRPCQDLLHYGGSGGGATLSPPRLTAINETTTQPVPRPPQSGSEGDGDGEVETGDSLSVSAVSSPTLGAAVEQTPVNQAQALSDQSTAARLSAKTLAEYRHVKHVLRQRLLRRYYDMWSRFGQHSRARESLSSTPGQASVSTQTLNIDRAYIALHPPPHWRRPDGSSPTADSDWNADVESMETVSLAGSSLTRQSTTPRTSASRGSSAESAAGRHCFAFPEPLPEPACLGATSRPSRLVDYGAHSDRPRRKGPATLSEPSTGLPSVVEAPLRVRILP